MSFTIQEAERIRYHMGYLNVQPAASITFGVPVPIQTLFLLDFAINNVLPEGEDRVRKILGVLDGIECKQIAAQDYLAVNSVDDIHIREDHIEALETEYARWAARLASQLGAPLYPGAAKFRRLFAAQGSGSIPVKNG